jgi:hypothetical protein
MVSAMAPYAHYYAPQNEPNGQIITAYIVGFRPPEWTSPLVIIGKPSTPARECFVMQLLGSKQSSQPPRS